MPNPTYFSVVLVKSVSSIAEPWITIKTHLSWWTRLTDLTTEVFEDIKRDLRSLSNGVGRAETGLFTVYKIQGHDRIIERSGFWRRELTEYVLEFEEGKTDA